MADKVGPQYFSYFKKDQLKSINQFGHILFTFVVFAKEKKKVIFQNALRNVLEFSMFGNDRPGTYSLTIHHGQGRVFT